MILFHLTAVDEFDRVYNYTQALSYKLFVDTVPFRVVAEYYFKGMVREVLVRMGIDASAEWSCVMEEFDLDVYSSE
jgi:hypothetical protein